MVEKKTKTAKKPKAYDKRKSANKKKRSPPYTEEQLHAIGQELVDFVSQDEIFHIVEWTESKGMCVDWWYKLRNKHKYLIDYHERAKSILGNKILKHAFKVNNSWAIQTFVPRYLSDAKKHLSNLEDEKLERQMKLERFRHELGERSDDEQKAKIDNFDDSITLMDENIKLKKLLKSLDIDISNL